MRIICDLITERMSRSTFEWDKNIILFFLFILGGKPDDVTVLVAVVKSTCL